MPTCPVDVQARATYAPLRADTDALIATDQVIIDMLTSA